MAFLGFRAPVGMPTNLLPAGLRWSLQGISASSKHLTLVYRAGNGGAGRTPGGVSGELAEC